jgi:hypothetical protein
MVPMTKRPVAWQRPLYEDCDRAASVVLFAFARAPLDLSVPLSGARHGLPEDFDANLLDITQHVKDKAPRWFEGFTSPELLSIARGDLGADVSGILDATAIYVVKLEVHEPADLGHLQAAWAAAKWLCELGAGFVLDEHAIRWWSSQQVAELDASRDFDIRNEISIVFETDARPGFGHVTHTRGLAKFGRPDLLLFGAELAEAEACGALLNALATRAALGATFRARQTIGPSGLPHRMLQEYEPVVRHPEVNLNNDGLVLQVDGWGLPRSRQ